jgi:hypothetical protein
MRRFGLVVTAAVGVGLGLVGNLAAGTISLPEQWRVGIWTMTALLAGAAVVGTVLDNSAPRRRSRQALAVERRRYLTRLVECYQRLDLEVLTPAPIDENRQMFLRSVFVAQHVRADLPPMEIPPELRRRLFEAGAVAPGELPPDVDAGRLTRFREAYLRQPARPVLQVLSQPEQHRIVLLGDPGAGKSTLARYVALTLALGSRSRADAPDLLPLAEHLPFLIELRGIADSRWRGQTFLDYLDHLHTTEGLGLPKDLLAEHLSADEPTVVIFDGLDEVFDPLTRETVARQIAAFASRYPAARIIVTSRIIGYRRAVLESAGFAHHTLQDLTAEQIEQFVDQWYGFAHPGDPAEAVRKRQRLMAAIRESAPIRDLAGNPLLLTVLSIIGRHQELPRARKGVYQHAVSVLVEHWDVNKYLHRTHADAPFISREDKLELLRRVARQMQGARTGQAGNLIPGAALLAEFESYLRDRYQLSRDRSAPAAAAMLAQFRERNFILSRFGSEAYGFVHRAFLEYLSADDIVHRFQAEHAWTPNELASEVFGRHHRDPFWREVLLLVAGMIDARDTGRAVRHLLAADPLWSMNPGDPPHHLIPAVQCLGEVDRLDRVTGEAHAILDSVAMTLEVIEDNIDDDPDRQFTVAGLEGLRDNVEPALARVGARWPGRERYLTWFNSLEPRVRGQFPDGCGRVRLAAAAFLAHLFADDDTILDLLRAAATFDAEGDVRSAAVEAMATAWHHDPRTLPFIRDLATDDHTLYTVVEMLAAHWAADPAALTFIRRHACTSSTWYIRTVAVRALASGWPDDINGLEFVRTVAVSDDHWEVRLNAVQTLATVWRTDPRSRALLHDLATHDSDAVVRAAAAQGLAAGWHDKPQTAPLLRKQATGDPDADVRAAATRILAAGWHDDPDTMATLRDRIAVDPDATVRTAAVQGLATLWQDDPQLLPLLHGLVTADPAGSARAAAIQSLADRGTDDPAIPGLLRDRVTDGDGAVRATAIGALATNWANDPLTLPLVRSRADLDPDPTVRAAALRALVAGWRDGDAAYDALRRAAGDVDLGLRRASVRALDAGWRDDPRTKSLVVDRAAEDEHWSVRRAAVRVLATSWHEDPQVLPLIANQALSDGDWRVRQAAVRSLSARWRDDPRTFPLLSHTATEDEDRSLRQAATRAIAANWRRDPRAMRLIHRLAAHDPSEEVRQTASNVEAVWIRATREDPSAADSGND